MQRNLIFDIGFHIGEDSDFYLKKGFRVVAVEANPELCATARVTFSDHISAGQLAVKEAAIAEKGGVVSFFENKTVSAWSTADGRWAERNERLGTTHTEIQVPAVTVGELVREFGIPYYMKVDIEGSDHICIEALKEISEFPPYVSFEAEKADMAMFDAHLKELTALGYQSFQLVCQHRVPNQKVPTDTREGRYIDYRFAFGCTGLFGKDLPERDWISPQAVLQKYRRTLRIERLLGHRGSLMKVPGLAKVANLNRTSSNRLVKGGYRFVRDALDFAGLRPGHYDLHARRQPAA